MPWVRFDDSTPDHPKLSALSSYAPLCGWLWFSACCYSMRYLTDGRIDLPTLHRLWPFTRLHLSAGSNGDGELLAGASHPTVDMLVAALVSVNLFEEMEAGWYRIHDFLEYNPSRREVTEARKKKQKAGQAGGLARAQASARPAGTAGKCPPSPSPSPNKVKDSEHAVLEQRDIKTLVQATTAKLSHPSQQWRRHDPSAR